MFFFKFNFLLHFPSGFKICLLSHWGQFDVQPAVINRHHIKQRSTTTNTNTNHNFKVSYTRPIAAINDLFWTCFLCIVADCISALIVATQSHSFTNSQFPHRHPSLLGLPLSLHLENHFLIKFLWQLNFCHIGQVRCLATKTSSLPSGYLYICGLFWSISLHPSTCMQLEQEMFKVEEESGNE